MADAPQKIATQIVASYFSDPDLTDHMGQLVADIAAAIEDAGKHLHDELAMAALTGMSAGPVLSEALATGNAHAGTYHINMMVECAYALADAMLAERAKEPLDG